MIPANCHTVIVSIFFLDRRKCVVYLKRIIFISAFLGWSTWSEWSRCNEDSEKVRYRKCLTTNPSSKECQGNEREVRQCDLPMANGSYFILLTKTIRSASFDIFSFTEIVQTAGIGAGTIASVCIMAIFICSTSSAFIMYMFMKKRTLPRDIKNIGSPCFDSFPNQYSSLPTKDERPKVKRQSSFNSGSGSGTTANTNNGAATKLLSNGHGTLTKANNVTSGHHTPKALAKSFSEDTATLKRNSHALNNIRPVRTIDDDKF